MIRFRSQLSIRHKGNGLHCTVWSTIADIHGWKKQEKHMNSLALWHETRGDYRSPWDGIRGTNHVPHDGDIGFVPRSEAWVWIWSAFCCPRPHPHSINLASVLEPVFGTGQLHTYLDPCYGTRPYLMYHDLLNFLPRRLLLSFLCPCHPCHSDIAR